MGRHSLREQTPGPHMTTCKSLCCTFHHWAETNLGGLQLPALERCREPRNAIGAVHSLAIFQEPKHSLHSSLTWWALSSRSLLCTVCRKLLPVSLSAYDTIMDTLSIVHSLKKHLKTVQTAVLEWTKKSVLLLVVAIDCETRADIHWKFLCMLFPFPDICSSETSWDRDSVFMFISLGWIFLPLICLGAFWFKLLAFKTCFGNEFSSLTVKKLLHSFVLNISNDHFGWCAHETVHNHSCPSFDIIDSCYIQLQSFLVQPVKSRIKLRIPSAEAIPLANVITHLFILFYI